MRHSALSSAINSPQNIHRLVYRIGSEAGFFSEYNNMILCLLYCLDNGLNFSLFSKDANFKTKNGWTDFFQPFCLEETSFWHSLINKRPYDSYRIIGVKSLEIISLSLYKAFHPNVILMQEVWEQARNQKLQKKYSLTSENDSYDLRTACRELIQLTWRYNSTVNEKCEIWKKSLNLPDQYLGFHIRGGDKFIEASQQEEDVYMKKAISLSDCKNAFILTDDYSVIERLRKNYQDWTFYTLCGENERGYFHKEFSKEDKEIRAEKLIKLFACVDIISESHLFIGTFSSNPGMYLGMRMEQERAFSVDIPNWRIW